MPRRSGLPILVCIGVAVLFSVPAAAQPRCARMAEPSVRLEVEQAEPALDTVPGAELQRLVRETPGEHAQALGLYRGELRTGLRLEYSNPMHLDDVAIDWPDMQIVMAHPSFPWQDEALSVATHKPNVWIDLSGWSPKYFPKQLVQYANTLLKDKILFGSDYPVMSPERWVAEFEKLPIKPEVRPLIMKQNAARLLKL